MNGCFLSVSIKVAPSLDDFFNLVERLFLEHHKQGPEWWVPNAFPSIEKKIKKNKNSLVLVPGREESLDGYLVSFFGILNSECHRLINNNNNNNNND